MGSAFTSGLPLEPLWSNRSAGLSLTFIRALDLPFALCAEAVAAWWNPDGPDGDAMTLSLGRGRLTGPPSFVGEGCRLPAALRPGFGCPPRAMTLELAPWFETFGTKLVLHPAGVVRGSRRYFSAGHDLLDRLIERFFAAGPGAAPEDR